MFADPDQFSLFTPAIGDIRSVLSSRYQARSEMLDEDSL
jgi:hypothetical protein